MRVIAQYIRTTNDRNGNPRRGWVVSSAEDGSFHGFIDEGYNGQRGLHTALAYVVNDPSVLEVTLIAGGLIVTPGQYRDMRRTPGVFSGYDGS